MSKGKMIINLAGDVMLGRLIDQLLPTSVHNPEEAAIIQKFRLSHSLHCPYLQEGKYTYSTVWGDTLSLWKEGDLNIINLETSVTNHDKLWPNKVFNYRTHPENIACLKIANIHHVSLANNHTLDFGIKGLEETCETLEKSGISYVGAGKTRQEALGPVFLDIPLKLDNSKSESINLKISFLSASDHPSDWSTVPLFHLLAKYDLSYIQSHLSPLINQARKNSNFIIFSFHWGPNYQWIPDKKIQELAKWLINEGVDVIHGHSSHHIQGIEIIERKNQTYGLILYGCGDFIDDYAIDEQYRNDLSAIFRLNLIINEKLIRIQSLSIFPTKCSNFQVNQLNSHDKDWIWIKEKLLQLSHINNKTWKIGQNNELIIEIDT